MRLNIIVDVPDIIGDLINQGLDDSDKVLIVPDSLHPGYVATIIHPTCGHAPAPSNDRACREMSCRNYTEKRRARG